VEALGRLGNVRAVEPIIKLLSDKDGLVRAEAAEALGRLKDERALAVLKPLLAEKDQNVKSKASEAIELITGNKIAANTMEAKKRGWKFWKR
jgi:HEAT repeat protein